MEPNESMTGRGREPAEGAAGSALSADEFAARFRDSSRVLWTVAAGVLGTPSEAEDVLQEACVMALSKLDHYERGTNFAAWMTSFVRNVALNHARKRQRRATAPAAPELLRDLELEDGPPAGARLPVNGNGELHADQEDFDDRLTEGLATLSAVQRSCLLLRTVLDQSYREIAATLGIPEGTAMSHVHRARLALRAGLSEELPARAPLREPGGRPA